MGVAMVPFQTEGATSNCQKVTVTTLLAAGPQGLSVGVSFSGDFSVLMTSKLASYEKYY